MGSYISRVVSRLTMVITYIGGLVTPLITTHEPPSKPELLTSLCREPEAVRPRRSSRPAAGDRSEDLAYPCLRFRV